MALPTKLTIDVVLASYIENRRDTPHTKICLPPSVKAEVDDDLRKSIWDDCIDNHKLSLEYVMDLRQSDLDTLKKHRNGASKADMNTVISTTVYEQDVTTMDMNSVIASLSMICIGNVVMSHVTYSLLTRLYPTEEKRSQIHSLVLRGYMADFFVFFLSISDGAVAKGLYKFKEDVHSLPDEIDELSVSKVDEEMPEKERNRLCGIAHVILESLETRHLEHIDAYMEEMRDKITPSQLRAIRFCDFDHGPPAPIHDAGACFDGLFTLWFWYQSKLEFARESVGAASD